MSRQILDMSNDKLEELFSKTNENFEEVYQTNKNQADQLNDLDNKKRDKSTKITTNDIDKSADSKKIQPNDLSQAVHDMMSGKSPVNPNIPDGSLTSEKYAQHSVTPKSIADKSITTRKVDFLVENLSDNLIDPTKITIGIPIAGGNYSSDARYKNTGYVAVSPGDVLLLTPHPRGMDWGTGNNNIFYQYDEDYNYLSSNNAELHTADNYWIYQVADDANIAYVKISLGTSDPSQSMLIKGSLVPTEFEEYKREVRIPDLRIKQSDIDQLSVGVLDTNFLTIHLPENSFLPDDEHVGYIADNGRVITSSGNYRYAELSLVGDVSYVYKILGAKNYGSSISSTAIIYHILDDEGNFVSEGYSKLLSHNTEDDYLICKINVPRLNSNYSTKVRINVSGTSSTAGEMTMIVAGDNADDYPADYVEPTKVSITLAEGIRLSDADTQNLLAGLTSDVADLIKSLSSLESRTTSIEQNLTDIQESISGETIDIASSAKIGFFSNSFLNGYTMKGKHPLNYLGMWSDYIMYNYGHSGDDFLECLARIEDDQAWLGDVKPSDYNLTYAVLAMQDNDGALFSADANTYYENIKKLAFALESQGAIPILGTEHDNNYFYYGLDRLAGETGYMLMDWGKSSIALSPTKFAPFWHSNHPATRTHWLWTYGMKKYLDTLPRPRKSLKLFRLRTGVNYLDIDDLVFSSNEDRSKLFSELLSGASVLTTSTEKYFDRLDETEQVYENVKDEYQALQSGSPVNFGDILLADITTPYTAKSITKFTCHIDADGIQHCYIKKINSTSNRLPATRYLAFGIVSGVSTISKGDTFTITGGVFNDNILGTYTVADVLEDMLITTSSSTNKTTSGTDNPTSNIEGLVLAGSYDYPSADYMTRFDKPLGEYIEVPISNREIEISDFINYMMYDKITLLFTGENILLRDLNCKVSGIDEKPNFPSKTLITRKKGTSLISDTTFSASTSWTGVDSSKFVDPISKSGSGTESKPTRSDQILLLNEGDLISHALESVPSAPYDIQRLQIRIIARYFPKYVATDEDWNSTELYEDSYDCATMDVLLNASSSDIKLGSLEVGCYWNEFILESDYRGSNKLSIQCSSKSLQIAIVECILLDQ